MANNLYTLAAIGATIRFNKSLIALFNATGSGKVLRIYKIWTLNNQSVAVTSLQILMELRKISAISGGGALTPLKHNTDVPTLPSTIVAAEGATTTNSSLLRRLIWSADEPLVSASTIDEFELNPNFTKMYYLNINNNGQGIEPITLREGEGITLNNTINTSAGQLDIFIEFTADIT